MPSMLHEALLQLFRNRPALAPELLREALRVELPEYSEARIDSAELNQIQPTEYRADLVVLLLRGNPVLGIVVEVQLAPDERKSFILAAHDLDAERRVVFDLVLQALSEGARRALQSMDPAKYEYQSDFAKHYVASGENSGPRGGPRCAGR